MAEQLPDVRISLSNNNLGRLPATEDGTMGLVATGVAISGQITLGAVYGPFRSIRDVEAKGITKAWDIANTCMVWHHANAMFNEAQSPTPLYLMVVAKTVTMAQMCDKDNAYARLLVESTQGKPRMVAITRIPDSGYDEDQVDGLDPDVLAAVAKAQELQGVLFGLHRPVRFLIEGRAFDGDVAAVSDLRAANGPNANAVGVVLGQEHDVATENAAYNDYAAVGRVAGRFARIPVQRSVGRVKDGRTGVVTASLSDGTLMANVTLDEHTVLDAKGYIYFRAYPDLAGFYINGGHSASPNTDDYTDLAYGRVIDKAARITYITYIQEILDDLEVDKATGKLPEATCKNFESIIEDAIGRQMAGEISGVGAFVDPDQDIITTDELAIQVDIVRRGIIRSIRVTLGYKKSLDQ